MAELTAVMSESGGGRANPIYLGELRKAEKDLQELERISRV
jgi:hypothetical protein